LKTKTNPAITIDSEGEEERPENLTQSNQPQPQPIEEVEAPDMPADDEIPGDLNDELGLEEEFFNAGQENEYVEEIEAAQPEPQMPRRSARSNKGQPPIRYGDFVFHRDDEAFAVFNDPEDPKTFKKAMSHEFANEWEKAMNEEIDSLEKNKTWEVCKLPDGKKAIGSKWVFKTKLDANGNVVRRKARAVAKGFSQKFGVDYDEVFAPVARSATFRIFLSFAGKRNLSVIQYDIVTAFLNGTIEEEIYMLPLPGFERADKMVYRLKKSLYGLKQAARAWNKALHESLTRHGCKRDQTDHCLYSLTSGGDIVHLLIHVDDVLAATSNAKLLDELMTKVGKDFELKCLGEAKCYLGIDLHRDNDGNFLISQPAYIQKIIDNAGMTYAKPSKFPLDTGYYKFDGKELATNEEFRMIIGSLLYLSTNTRPDIAASVSILSKRIKDPQDTDLNEAKRIIRYLKGTKDLKLRLSSSDGNSKMFVFSDSDWGEDRRDGKSNSGMYCSINGGAIMWSCRKQDIVAL
jgi:Reverse transcriptase (RNA-dependent DNA polymerase)